MDELDRSFERLFAQLLRNEFGVFIGEENPVRNIQNFTVITGRYKLPQGERGYISVIGPRRMDYKKNMALVEYVSSVIGR
jgi:heat-inducible transcriptional repressor